MSLESTFICLDTSGYMRNGDYYPTRLASQEDASRFIIDRKLMANPENQVGMISGNSKGVRLLSAETDDPGKLLACLHGLVPEGDNDFISLLKTAKLALKHRKMTTGGKRVVVFVGSPLKATEKELKATAVSLKRDNIAVDVIATGEVESNSEPLKVFHDAVVKESDGRPNSELLIVPAGIMPLEMLTSSSMYSDAAAFGEGGAPDPDRFAEYGGIDPSIDPELAFAMQASLAEARAMEEAQSREESSAVDEAVAASLAEEETSGQGDAAPATEATTTAEATTATATETAGERMAEDTQSPAQGESATATATATATASGDASASATADEEYLMSLVGNVPGLQEDPELLASLLADTGDKKPDTTDASKKDDKKEGK